MGEFRTNKVLFYGIPKKAKAKKAGLKLHA